MKHQVGAAAGLTDGCTVHEDDILLEVHAGPRLLNNATVHSNTAGGDHGLAIAAGGYPGAGEDFLQTFCAHSNLLSAPHAGQRYTRRPSPRHRAEALRRAQQGQLETKLGFSQADARLTDCCATADSLEQRNRKL
jgi:hypothetical protein